MGLLKLISNRISTEWKKTFNDNVDYLTGLEKKQDEKLDAVNSRVNNLVLHSGGESPNEVTDARVNNKGETFDTLQGRLTAAESKHDTDTQNVTTIQTDQQKQLEQLNNGIGKLMGTYGTTLDFYVSASRGDDKSGDGTEKKPFKTIQMAVNQFPLVSTSTITVYVDDSTYLEDVVIRAVKANVISIRSIQNVNGTPDGDLAVKVRSIGFYYCSGYFQVYGMQLVDTANAATFENYRYGFLVEQGGYLAVASCKAVENTKGSSYESVYVGGNSKSNVYGGTTFINQNIAMRAKLMAELNIGDIKGSGNETGVLADAATVRGNLSSSFAATPTKAISNGLIITKGTVLP